MYGTNAKYLSAADAVGKDTNAIMAGWVDRGPWQYWDTLTGNPGTALQSEYLVFQVPIGAQNPLPGPNPKTKLQTNMTKSGEFPPPRCMLVMQLGIYFSSRMIKTDIDAFLDSCYFEFRIDDKIFHEGIPVFIPSGAGLAGLDNNSGVQAYTLGLPAPVFARRYDEWAKYIAPTQQFSMKFVFPGTPPTMSGDGPGLYAVVFMDGLTDRSVQ